MEIESESLEDIELGIHFVNDTLEKNRKIIRENSLIIRRYQN